MWLQLPTILSPPTPCTPVLALTVLAAGQVAKLPLFPFRDGFRSGLRHMIAGSPMHQAESSSSLSCLLTGHSLPAAPPPRLSTTQLPSATDRPVLLSDRTFTLLLVRTFRRTSFTPSAYKSKARFCAVHVLEATAARRLNSHFNRRGFHATCLVHRHTAQFLFTIIMEMVSRHCLVDI